MRTDLIDVLGEREREKKRKKGVQVRGYSKEEEEGVKVK